MLKTTCAAACRVPRVRARLAGLLLLSMVALASGLIAKTAKAADHNPADNLQAADHQRALHDLQALDLLALRRDVAAWRAAYSGPIAGKVAAHASTVQQIIDQLTVLKREAERNESGNPQPQIAHEIARLHSAWPAWLMADFDPPSSLRTVIVNNAAELRNAVAAAQPGDEIILADGRWRELPLDELRQLTGSTARPIVVRAHAPGRVFVTAGQVALPGVNVIFRNLTFESTSAQTSANSSGTAPGEYGSGEYGPCFAFAGRNVRVSNCLFTAPRPAAGVILQAEGLRFDHNYIAGLYAGSALRVSGSRSKLDNNYFGWRLPPETATHTGAAALEIQAGASAVRVQTNFFTGPGANLLDAGHGSLIADNTFQNIPQPALATAAPSRGTIIRGNLAFDTGGFEFASSDARLSNNYLEYGEVTGASLAQAEHNTWLLPPESPAAQTETFDPGLLRGASNLVCTEIKMLWPREPQLSHNSEAIDSEDSRTVNLIRDVMGYLRPHRRFGDLGFSGDVIPLGRSSDVGPAWLPTEYAINRPLLEEFQQSAISSDDPFEQSLRELSLSANDAAIQAANLLQPHGDSWTLQGWVHNPRSGNQACVLAEATAGEDHWKLSWTEDRRLVLSGETGGAAWSVATEPDYESEAGRSYFAVVAEHQRHGWEVSFYRGNEVEAVDLVAAELAPALAFLEPAGISFVPGTPSQQGLITARLFCTPETSVTAGAPQFGVLNASDLESLRRGDLLPQ